MHIDEFPVIRKPWKKGQRSVAIVFPNLYRGGAYCFGQLIFYNLINNLDGWSCGRRFFDNDSDLSNFDLIGFTFQYELDYFNFLTMLRSNKIPLDKEKREQIIFAGGPCITSNPETLAEHIDFFFLGDAEDSIKEVLEAYAEHISKGKGAFLESVASIRGVFVPGLSEKQTYGLVDLDAAPHPLFQPLPTHPDKNLAFGEAFMLEIERGCPYHCSFCSIPRTYSSFQCRKIETLFSIIEKGTKFNRRQRVALYSPSFTHPQRKELLQHLLRNNLTFSVPSLRVEYATEDILRLVKQGGQKTLTVAPECNESLRYKIGKKISNETFFEFFRSAEKLSFKNIKLYMMVGLPGQSNDDLDELVAFVRKAKLLFRNRLYLSINPFVPKRRLPLADHQFDKKTVTQQLKYLRRSLPEIRTKTSDVENSYLEWRLAHATSLARFINR